MLARTIGAPISRNGNRLFYSGFSYQGREYKILDVIFANASETEERFKTKEALYRSYYIAVIDTIFVDETNPKVKGSDGVATFEVECGLRWFYKPQDLKKELNSDSNRPFVPPLFETHSDELILSDHHDENPAEIVEGKPTVVMCLDTRTDTLQKLPKDGKHYNCRLMWLSGQSKLVPLSRAVVLDGDTPQRPMIIARQLTYKCLGNGKKITTKYIDPPKEEEESDSDDAELQEVLLASKQSNKRKRTTSKSSNGKKSKTTSQPTTSSPVRDTGITPSFDQVKRLLLSRGELCLLSKQKSGWLSIVGCFVLLKHKAANGSAKTTLHEITRLPDVATPYRQYDVSYRDAQGHQAVEIGCTAGIELLMDDDFVQRRSIVNIRDRALTADDYEQWSTKRLNGSHYPASEREIETRIKQLSLAKDKYTKNRVRPLN